MLIARRGDDMHNIGVGIYDLESQQGCQVGGRLARPLTPHSLLPERSRSIKNDPCCANFNIPTRLSFNSISFNSYSY
jgi:hypothetical protein